MKPSEDVGGIIMFVLRPAPSTFWTAAQTLEKGAKYPSSFILSNQFSKGGGVQRVGEIASRCPLGASGYVNPTGHPQGIHWTG